MRPRAFWPVWPCGFAVLRLFEVSYGVHLYTGHDA
jgi:hypothetical protein